MTIPIDLPPCFFCGHDFEKHYRNRQMHPWRVGSRVTLADLERADKWTRELWVKSNEYAYNKAVSE